MNREQKVKAGPPGCQGLRINGLLLLVIALASCQSSQELKLEQYYSEGYQLYTTHCANCHQAEGTGLANLYPPIKGSSYLLRKADLVCIIKNGLAGEILVNGKTYNRPMPANPKLPDLEIAEIVTYVNNTWGKDTTYTPTDSVTDMLTLCGGKQ